MANFSNYQLDEKILKVLSEINYETPTPIQEQAIPQILDGADLIASAQTGTGKTGAFMLPILHRLEQKETESTLRPQVLVLVPTRELALQVAEETKKYSKYLKNARAVCIYGGVPYPIQRKALAKPYDILIATPGRLIDHVEQNRVDLSNINTLVLDEADRMLDMGFIDSVEMICAKIPKKRQTLLFSATIDNKILPISKKLQNNPFEIRVKQDLSVKDNIEATLYYVDDIHHKMRLLDHLLDNLEMTQMIIFASTIVQTKTLARYLQDKKLMAGALHGDMDQKQRTKTINRLRKGNIQFLVATDVAARGIDIASLSHVINFDLPFHSEDFIHRIGRTGRAGAKGSAITFGTYKEALMIKRIEKVMGKPLPCITVEGLEPKTKAETTTPQPIRRSRGSRRNDSFGRTFGEKRFNREKPFDGERSFEPKKTFGEKRSFNREKSFDGERSFEPKKSFGEKRSFNREKSFDSERSFEPKKSFGEKRSFNREKSFDGERSFEPKKSFGEKRSFNREKSFDGESSFEPKKTFGEKRSFNREKSFDGKRSFEPKKSFGEKRSFNREKSFDSERSFEPKKSFGEKRSFNREKSFDGERSFEPKKTFGEKRSFNREKSLDGERSFEPKKSFGEKRSFNREKSFDGDRSFGDFKKPFGGKKPFGENRSFDRFSEPRKSFSEKKSFGANNSFNKEKSFESKMSFGSKKSFGEKRPFEANKPAGKGKFFAKGPRKEKAYQ